MELTTHELSNIFLKHQATEMSYLDLLNKLTEQIKSDAIPEKDKKEIFVRIEELKYLLWKYSY